MSYGCAVGFFYNLNLIVGSGFLAIPYVLVRSGLLTGVLTLLVVAFFSALTARWILETMYRGEVRRTTSQPARLSHYFSLALPCSFSPFFHLSATTQHCTSYCLQYVLCVDVCVIRRVSLFSSSSSGRVLRFSCSSLGRGRRVFLHL